MSNIIDGIKWTYGFWEFEGHGNHRAKVVVKDASDYNRVIIKWRRHDNFNINHKFLFLFGLVKMFAFGFSRRCYGKT